MDKGKVKMPKYGDPDYIELTHSLNSESDSLDAPIMRTPEAKKELTSAGEKL